MNELTILTDIRLLKTCFTDLNRPFEILEYQIDGGAESAREVA